MKACWSIIDPLKCNNEMSPFNSVHCVPLTRTISNWLLSKGFNSWASKQASRAVAEKNAQDIIKPPQIIFCKGLRSKWHRAEKQALN